MLRGTHEQSLHALLDDLSPDAKLFQEEEASLHFSASADRRARSTTYHLDETPPRFHPASPPPPLRSGLAAVQVKSQQTEPPRTARGPAAVKPKPSALDRASALRDAVNALDRQSHTSRSSSANSAVFRRLSVPSPKTVARSTDARVQPRRAAPQGPPNARASGGKSARDASAPSAALAVIAPDFDVALSPLSASSPQRGVGRSASLLNANHQSESSPDVGCSVGSSGASNPHPPAEHHHAPTPHTVGPRARRELMALYEHLNSVVRYSAMPTVLQLCGLPNDQASCDDVWFELVGGMSAPYVTADRFIVVLARRGAEVDMAQIHHEHRHDRPRNGGYNAVMSPAAADDVSSSDEDNGRHRHLKSAPPTPTPKADEEARTASPNPRNVPPPLQLAVRQRQASQHAQPSQERQASQQTQPSQTRAASVRSTSSSTLSRRPTAALSPSGAPVVSFDAYDSRALDKARHSAALAAVAGKRWNADTGVQRRTCSIKERLQTRQQQHAQALAAAVAISQPRTEAGGGAVFDASARPARRPVSGALTPEGDEAATFHPHISDASRRLAELRRAKHGQQDISTLATESSARKVHSHFQTPGPHRTASPVQRLTSPRPDRVPTNSYAARLDFKRRHTDPTHAAAAKSPRSPPRLADLQTSAMKVESPRAARGDGELQRAADALRHFLARDDKQNAARLGEMRGRRETYIGLAGEGLPKSMAPTPPPVREREAAECTFTPITHRAPDSEASRIEAARFFQSLNSSSASASALPPAPAAAARPAGYFEAVARLRRSAALRDVDPKRRSGSSDVVYRNGEFFTTLRASPTEPYVPPHTHHSSRPVVDDKRDAGGYQQHAHSVNTSGVYDPQWTGAHHPIIVPSGRCGGDGTAVTFQTPTEAAFTAAAAAPPSMAAAAAARGDGFTEAVAICAGEESAAALARLRALLSDPGINQVEGATYRSLVNPLAVDALEASAVQLGGSSASSAALHTALRPLLHFPGAQAAAQGSSRALVVSPATDVGPLSAMTSSSAVLVLPPSSSRRGSDTRLDPHTLGQVRDPAGSSLTAAAGSLSSCAGATRPLAGAAVDVAHYDPTVVGPRRFSIALCTAYGLDPTRFAPAVERDLRVILRAAVVAETGGPAAVDVESYEARWRRRNSA